MFKIKTEIVSIGAKIVFPQNCRDVKKWGFQKENCIFCLFMLQKEKQKKEKYKMEKAQNPKQIVFFEVDIKEWEKWKKWIFRKNCLTLVVSGRQKKWNLRAHYLFWPKNCLGPKQSNSGKLDENSGFSEIAENQKWHLFFFEKVFLGWVKSGLWKLCFWKLCSSENSIFGKTQQLQ